MSAYTGLEPIQAGHALWDADTPTDIRAKTKERAVQG